MDYDVCKTTTAPFDELLRLARKLKLPVPPELLEKEDNKEEINVCDFMAPMIDKIREDAVREAEGEIRRKTRLETKLEVIKDMLSEGLSHERICSLMKISNDELSQIRALAPAGF